MISWIQTYFQKHFRIIFAVLLVFIIISFVFTIGASPGIGRAEGRAVERPFFDLNLSNGDDQARLMGDANLSAYLRAGFNNFTGEQLQNYALSRYAGLYLANQLHVPAPGTAELSEFIKGLRAFASQTGEFDPIAYNRFRDSLKSNRNLSEADITRVLNNDYRVEQVQKLFAGPGYVLPTDVQQQLARIDTSWTIAVATISYDSFKPALQPTPAQLDQYFKDNGFRYEQAPRFSGSYIEFSAAPLLEKQKISEADIKAAYDANPSRFAAAPKPDAKPEDKKEDPAALYEKAKPQVEMTLRIERARREAQKLAADFTVILFEKKVPQTELPKLLQDRGLVLKPLTPFARNETISQLPGSEGAVAEAFKLNPSRYYTDALPSSGGAVVLFYKETIPSRMPLLSEVREKVLSDYLESERRKGFVELGKALKDSIELRLKSGQSFASAVTAATTTANVTGEAKTLPAFTLRTPPQDLDYAAFGALERLEKGQVSDMTISGPKGVIVHAADKKAPDLSETSEQYAAIRSQIARATAAQTGGSIFSELIEREIKRSNGSTGSPN